MTKYILPFLMFVSVGLSEVITAKDLADILQGASREYVQGLVFDVYDTLDKELKDSLGTKLELGMKRNKLSYEEGKNNPAKWSKILITVATTEVGGNTIGYTWSVNIKRFVRSLDGKHNIKIAPTWFLDGGSVGDSAKLKEAIEIALDKVFLAYLELKE